MADSSNEDRLLRSALGKTAGVPSGGGAGAWTRRRGRMSSAARTAGMSWRCWWNSRKRAAARGGRRGGVDSNRNWSALRRRRRRPRLPRGLWSASRFRISAAFPSRGWQMVPVAAALLLVLAGGIYLRQGNEGPAAAGGQASRRGARKVCAVAPLGDVAAAPAELRWEAVPGAARYLVRVMEVDRTEIWRGEARRTRIARPAEVRRADDRRAEFPLGGYRARYPAAAISRKPVYKPFTSCATSR